ncbi:MAG: glycosyltransferase [Bacteroidetes bacterium]|nr:glycosyltransferase [Bacteroidota bacterium]
MPKVLRIINRFNLGGITYNVSYLSKYLPADYETLLIGGPQEEGEESSLFIPHSLGLKPIIIQELKRSINPLNDYFAYKKVVKIIRDFKPDIVHTHASKAGAIGRLAAYHCKVPVIVHTFHGHVFNNYFSNFKSNIFKIIERAFAKKSTAIVAISNIQKQEISTIHKICDPAKIFVIPLGFNLEKFTHNSEQKRKLFREKYNIQDEETAIGIVGRLAPIKNHRLFIDGIEHLLKNTNKKIKAVIIGDGETKEELFSYIKAKKISYTTANDQNATFVFTSWIKQVDEALPGLDLICLTSKNEGTPVSLIEAQAAGCYIVSTNVGGIKDILIPKAGLLSELGDDEGYKKNLLKAVSELGKLNVSSKEISEAITQKFSYKRLCSDMDLLYRDLLKRNKN